MEDLLMEWIKRCDLVQLLAIGVMFWFFYSRIDTKIEKLENRLDAKIEKLDTKMEKLEIKVDKLDAKVEDIDRRLCRIEGSLATQGHCLFNQCKPEQKVE